MKVIWNKIFRYKLTASFFIAGQLIVYFTVFGALGIYNKAYDKEKDRLEALYNNKIQLEVTTSKKIDILSNIGLDMNEGNVILAGRLSLAIQEMNKSYRCEMILAENEPMKYKLSSGRLPGSGQQDSKSVYEAAVGKNKAAEAQLINGEKYLTIEGNQYKIVGILGSGRSDYWDDKIVLNVHCIGENVAALILEQQNYTIEIGSDGSEMDLLYKTVYGNIKSADEACYIEAKKLHSIEKSTMEKTFAEENMKVNIITFIFCILNCMITSEFWVLQRRKEFAIKKAFGMSNFRIIKDIAVNVFLLSVFSFLVFLALYILFTLFKVSLGFTIAFSFTTLSVTIATIFTSIAATLFYPIYKLCFSSDLVKYI